MCFFKNRDKNIYFFAIPKVLIIFFSPSLGLSNPYQDQAFISGMSLLTLSMGVFTLGIVQLTLSIALLTLGIALLTLSIALLTLGKTLLTLGTALLTSGMSLLPNILF